MFIQCPAFECLFGGSIGGGKALNDDEFVLSPFGWKRIGDIQTGDRVCATDGSVTEVIGVYPQGEKELWAVKFSDGAVIEADADHNWFGWKVEKLTKIGNRKLSWKDSAQVWKTHEIREWIERSGKRFGIPVPSPVTFNVAGQLNGPANFIGREIDPYFLGLLLGDGCITSENITITSADSQIIEYLCADREASVYETDSKAQSVRFTGDSRRELVVDLTDLGLLGTRSNTKFVPRQYMMAGIEDRWEMLRGLMDTDGWAEEGRAIHFSSASKDLAENVRDLALSLGASVTMRVKPMKHIKDSYFDAHCVRMKFQAPEMAFNLERKKAVARTIKHQSISRYIESVKFCGTGKATCIQVRHPNGLFITSNFIVTHNSDALLGDFARGLGQGSMWRGVYFRRFFPDMDDIIHRSMEIFGPVFGEKCYSASRHQWNFPGGEVLMFRAIEKDIDTYKFQGQQFSWVGFDELTQWASPFPYTYLFTRLRSAKGAKVRMRAASNPGGPGHGWVKARFIDQVPPGVGNKVLTKSGDSYWRVFIPARLSDNKILTKNDPGYADRIYELTDPVLARALAEGDWNMIADAALPEWDPAIHVIDPAPIPTDKPIWRSMDWGFIKPYACGWLFPDNDGNVILANELYGWSGQPNVGTQEPPGEVRKKIESFESLHEIYVPMGLLDGQCWDHHGHATMIADELGGRALGWKAWPKGQHSRVQQKQILHQFLAVVNGKSRLKVMRNCRHTIRTLPILPRDKHNLEDVDTNSEDHCYDMLRAALTKRVPTRDQLKKRAMNRRMIDTGFITASELRGGGF